MVDDKSSKKTAESAPKKAPQLIRDYWPRYHRQAILITILMQIAVAIVAAMSLFFAGLPINSLEFIMVLVATSATAISCNILLIGVLMQPLRDVTAAITHASDEATDVIPPNPNARNYQRTGFKPVLQFIYDRAVNQHTPDSKTADDNTSTALIESALSQTTAGLAIVDETGAIVYANKQAPVVTTKTGEREFELIFEGDPIDVWLATQRETAVHAAKTWLRVPNKLVGSEGRRIFDICVSYEKGSRSETVLMFFDRTELYKPEDDQLDFLSFAAHELRGPITVIRGYLDVLAQEIEQTPENAEHRLLIGRITVSANRLSGYINNILNASRYDRRHMHVNLSEQKLRTVYDSVSDDMNLRASTQGRFLDIKIDEALPTVAADPSSLSEVFSNLIDNAIKYSNPGGTVTIQAAVDRDMVRVDIIDHGIGMPANVVNNLFHKFYRSHRSRETVAGTGIGLYISKGIVESHGGTIEVVSEVDQGSTFSFWVPIYATVAEKLKKGDNTNSSMIRANTNGWIKNHAKYRG